MTNLLLMRHQAFRSGISYWSRCLDPVEHVEEEDPFPIPLKSSALTGAVSITRTCLLKIAFARVPPTVTAMSLRLRRMPPAFARYRDNPSVGEIQQRVNPTISITPQMPSRRGSR